MSNLSSLKVSFMICTKYATDVQIKTTDSVQTNGMVVGFYVLYMQNETKYKKKTIKYAKKILRQLKEVFGC